MHGQPLHLQQTPGFGYYGQHDSRQNMNNSYSQKQDTPLMLENTRSMDYVTDRKHDRESHLRTPSPSKRRFA